MPPPWGLQTRSRAVERLDAVGEAAQARAGIRVGAADAVVRDLDYELAALARDGDRRRRRLGVLGHIGEPLGDDVVRGHLDCLGRAFAQPDVQRHRHG